MRARRSPRRLITAWPSCRGSRSRRCATTLPGDEADSDARFLEAMIGGVRMANIYLPNGNPMGTPKFEYKLAWMDRPAQQMCAWLKDGVPTVMGGDFNVIPEDIDCHKPSSWMRDALFQPEPEIALPRAAGARVHGCISLAASG